MKPGDIAAAVGKGITAGLVGTAAITASSTIEMKLRHRPPSEAPARVGGEVLGVEPKGEEEKKRFSNLMHWGYGTMWGAARGLIDALGLHRTAASGAHFAAVWGTALVMLPAADAARPVYQWKPSAIGLDAFHHLVYAFATGLAYDYLDRHSQGKRFRLFKR
jgi:hypothetical protein